MQTALGVNKKLDMNCLDTKIFEFSSPELGGSDHFYKQVEAYEHVDSDT